MNLEKCWMLWSDTDILLLVHVNDSGAVEGSSQRLHGSFLQNTTMQGHNYATYFPSTALEY